MMQSFLKKLITFRTISADHRVNAQALRWVRSVVHGLPLIQRMREYGGFPTLTLRTQKTATPIVWLAAHIDVVPGSAQTFRSVIRGNRLYGRGAHDMKFAIACYLRLLHELKDQLHELDFGVLLTSDEEIGGANGTPRIIRQKGKTSVCILPDGGSAWRFSVGAKGVLRLHVESQGTAAHGSRPWLGINAISQLMSFLELLSREFPKEPCGDSTHWHRTMNVGVISGGSTANQIPDHASATIDIRFRDSKECKRITQYIDRCTQKCKGIMVRVESHGESYRNPVKSPVVQRFIHIAEQRFHIRTSTSFAHGTSDGRYICPLGIPVIITRPVGGGSHSEKEWTDLRDLERFYQVVKAFVLQEARIK